MPPGSATPALALVVPFHNERRHLDRLIASLRSQSVQNVPVVFVDNASSDGSAALLESCGETRTGKWICIKEKRVGKFYAMATGTAFCFERLGHRCIGFLDADSYCADSAWVNNAIEIVESANSRFGYTYSRLLYFGFGDLPIFIAAYRAYEEVWEFLIENVGWLAHGNGFVCSAEILAHYFRNAHVTTEIDLRCSLLALSGGYKAYFNATPIRTSARRIIVNPHNFAAWCFYQREFYSKKDINTRLKLDLNVPANVDDLRRDRAEHFFRRRAVKLASRHLIPLAIFDRSLFFGERISAVLEIDIRKHLDRLSRRFSHNSDYLLTDGFETMIRVIERDYASAALANRIEALMRENYYGSYRAELSRLGGG